MEILRLKKKISDITQLSQKIEPQRNVSLVGELLTYLRSGGFMVLYSGVALAKEIRKEDKTLIIEVGTEGGADLLCEEHNRVILENYCKTKNMELKLVVAGEDERKLVEKLKTLLGNKLEIEE